MINQSSAIALVMANTRARKSDANVSIVVDAAMKQKMRSGVAAIVR